MLERNLLAPMPREALILGTGVYYAVLFLFHVVYVLAASLIFLDLDFTLTASGVAVAGGLLIAMSLMSILLGFLMAGRFASDEGRLGGAAGNPQAFPASDWSLLPGRATAAAVQIPGYGQPTRVRDRRISRFAFKFDPVAAAGG